MLADRDVVVVEHPGHGAAPVVDVAGVAGLAARTLEQVGDERFAFVGLSLGGAVGMQLALDVPERVEKLVLACTSARFGDPQQWLDRAATVRGDGLEAIVDVVLARWFVGRPEPRWREMLLSVEPEDRPPCRRLEPHGDLMTWASGLSEARTGSNWAFSWPSSAQRPPA